MLSHPFPRAPTVDAVGSVQCIHELRVQTQTPYRMALLLAAGLLGGLLSASPSPSKSAIVDLGYHQYQGVSLDNGVDEYLGMRYAKAPMDDLRFRAPQDPDHNGQLLDASSVRFWGCRAGGLRATR